MPIQTKAIPMSKIIDNTDEKVSNTDEQYFLL